MMSLVDLSEIVSKIVYKDWAFRVLRKGDGFLFQVNFIGKNTLTGKMELQKCRKWYISSHACEGEIVRTVYKAIEAAELHEMQEQFRYCGQTIFDPHIAPQEVAALIAKRRLAQCVRKEHQPIKIPKKGVLGKPRIGARNGRRHAGP